MNNQQIKDVISKYDELLVLVVEKLKILKEVNCQYYSTYDGIENIEFQDTIVNVTCSEIARGDYSSSSFTFPLFYLTLSREELIFEALKEKEIKKAIEKLNTEHSRAQATMKKEQSDLEQYRKLKAKFENQ